MIKKSNDLICYTKIDRKKAIQLHQYPKLGPIHFSISSKLIPFRSAKLSTWSFAIFPTPKYLASRCAKYQPLTAAVGVMAMLSVKLTPVISVAFKIRNKSGFSVWSGQAG